MTDRAASPAAEYLEALFEMAEEDIPPIQARLAEWMGVSRATVSEAVGRLVEAGLLARDGRRLRFTEEGDQVARQRVRRHRLVERFLIEVLGLPWHRSHEEAQRWEAVISSEVAAKMAEILDDPATCPHGNPIPGSKHRVDHSKLVPLKEVPSGARVVLRRLTEDLELQLDVMRFLEESGLMPGCRIRIGSVAPDGTMTLHVQGRSIALGDHLSDNLWVEPA